MFVNLWGCCINVPVVSCAFRKHTWITCVFFLLMGCIQTLRSTLFQSAQYLLLLKCYLVVEEGPFVVDKLDLNSHNSWTKTILPESSSAGILVWLSTWSSYPGRFLTRRSDLFCEWDDLGNTAYCLPAFAWFFFPCISMYYFVPNVQTFQESSCLRLWKPYCSLEKTISSPKAWFLSKCRGKKSHPSGFFSGGSVDPFSMTWVIFSA